MLSNQPILALAAAACLIPSSLAADPYAAVLEKLSRIAPLSGISSEGRERVIASLPKEGEVQVLTLEQRQKLESVAPVLNAHGRESDYLLKVVESRQARLAIHARFVVLVTLPALNLLTPAQLQAVVAHELGHQSVWEEYADAEKRNDWRRIRELELFCDGIALSTLVRIGAPPSTLIDALRLMLASDQQRGIVTDPTRNSHPSISDRARFAKELSKRLAIGVIP